MTSSKFDCKAFSRINVGRLVSRLLAVFLLSTVFGCASWTPVDWKSNIWSDQENSSQDGDSTTKPKQQHTSTSVSRQSGDNLSLSVEFRHVPVSLLTETTWSLVDETAIPAGVRQAWLRNGMRIGVITVQQPIFSTSLSGDKNGPSTSESSDPINAFLAGAEVMGKKAEGRELIPLRPAHRHEMPLSPTLEGEQVVLVNRSNGLIGQRFDSPQMVLALKAQRGPRAGQASLDIRPEIHHGAVKQQFISSDTAVRIHAGRERWDLTELHFTWAARPGTTLVIAPAIDSTAGQPTFGLGNQMLRDDQHIEDNQHLIALIQLTP